MHIAFDASQAGFTPRVGIPHYVHHLLDALVRTDRANDYTIYYQHGHNLGINSPHANVRWQPLRSPPSAAAWSQLRLPLALARHSFDVVHIPAHRVPWLRHGKLVTTIHDLVFLKFPETLRPGHRQRLIWYVRNAVRRSARLIAISESTKRDICEWFGVSADKIDVVPHGVDHSIFHPSNLPSSRSSPYILSVGTLQPRKNFVMLIRAFKRLRETWREPIELLIAGRRGWLYEPIEDEAAKTKGVHLLGYVPDGELPGLYAGAALVTLPSIYEGFGLPVAEAMACGAPVVAADTPVFREVAGGGAEFLDPNDLDAWAETMRALLTDATKCERLRQQGLMRVKDFSWERTAEQTVAVYQKTVS